MATPLLQIQGAQRAQTSGNFYSFLVIHGFFKNHLFARQLFHLSSSLLQMTIMLHPSRIRHNGDTGADVQQGPVSRILFRLRPCVNLSYCLLLIHIPRILSTIEKDADVLACVHVRTMHIPGQGLLTQGIVLPGIIKTEHLRECSASRVRPYMHQLRIMSLVKCWVCPAPVFWCLTFRFLG